MKILYFTSVVIIQSLSKGFESGRVLYECLDQYVREKNSPVSIEFKMVSDEAQLLGFFSELDSRARNCNEVPIIHFECHGSDEHMVLADSSLISWESLNVYLAKINEATRFNLWICIGACYSFYINEKISINSPAPFCGLLSFYEEVNPDSVFGGFLGFYTTLIESSDGDVAFASFLEKTKNDGIGMVLTAEGYFKAVWKKYLRTCCTRKAYRKTAGKYFQEISGSPPDSLSLKKLVWDLKADRPNVFERFRRRFFLLDIIPENLDRFPVRQEDI